MQELISPERLDAAHQAIHAVCHTKQPKEFSLLAGGYSSSQTYKATVNDKVYVLRVMGLDQALTDREKQIQCLSLASEAGIAPHCYYADASTGMVVMEYIQPAPCDIAESWFDKMAYTLRVLHNIDIFPAHDLHSVFSYMAGFIENLKAFPLSKLLTDYFEKIAQIRADLSNSLLHISCHNDLNGNNIMFNGQKIYLVDWEAAGLDDPFIDIATICNQFAHQPSQLEYFLQHYFDSTPNAEQREKLHLMRQVSYCYYAMHFLHFAASAGLSLAGLSLTEVNLDAWPTPQEWLQHYRAREYGLATSHDFLLYAMVQVKASLAQIV